MPSRFNMDGPMRVSMKVHDAVPTWRELEYAALLHFMYADGIL